MLRQFETNIRPQFTSPKGSSLKLGFMSGDADRPPMLTIFDQNVYFNVYYPSKWQNSKIRMVN